jgi:hypothetical protein
MILWLLLFCIRFSNAEFNLESGLTTQNRIDVLKVLGLGSSSKNISTLKPLGVDSGVEIGIAFEFIDTSAINNFIADEQTENILYYPKILIGKGIYERVDLFFHFIPYTATFGLSEFGTLLRLNFYQNEAKSIYSSVILHANSANFNNQLVSRNLGTDLMLGYRQSAFSVFTTLGWAGAYGKFVGGTDGITASLIAESEAVNALHKALGVTYEGYLWNATLSYDHYEQPVYSAKVSFAF